LFGISRFFVPILSLPEDQAGLKSRRRALSNGIAGPTVGLVARVLIACCRDSGHPRLRSAPSWVKWQRPDWLRPLTTRVATSYDQVPIFPSGGGLRSGLVVSRSGFKLLKGLAILMVAGTFHMLVGAKPVGAAGCHVPDRPVLGTRLSWEIDSDLDVKGTREAQPPPVLTHPPCPGEVPHRLVPPRADNGSAHLDRSSFDPLDLPGFLRILDDPAHLGPHRGRLDRPPRPPAGCPSSM
jgi:hypothetical protein